MSLKLRRKKGSAIPPLEAGTYMAVCVGIIDTGEQKNERFNSYAEKVIVIFEIPSERVEVEGESKPRWLSETYTASLSEKSKLAPMLTSWRGRSFSEEELSGGFDLAVMLGKSAMIQVLCNEKEERVYNNIAAVTGIPKGIPEPKAESELLLYDIEEPDEGVFEKLPEWIREKIRKSAQYQQSHIGTEELDIEEEKAAPELSAERSGAF